MKKSLMTFALVVLAVSTFAGTFNLGLKVGYNSSLLTEDFAISSAQRQGGYTFGAFGRFGGKKLYFQPELLYILSNVSYTTSSPYETIFDAVKLKSVQVPALIGFMLINQKVGKMYIFTGPALSLFSSYESEKGMKYNYNITAVQLGAGVDIQRFTLDVRYSWSTNKIDNKPSNLLGNYNNFSTDVNVFSISLGIKILQQ